MCIKHWNLQCFLSMSLNAFNTTLGKWYISSLSGGPWGGLPYICMYSLYMCKRIYICLVPSSLGCGTTNLCLATLGPLSQLQPSESLWPTHPFRCAPLALVDLLAPCSWTTYLEYSHPCRSACPWENCFKIPMDSQRVQSRWRYSHVVGSSLPLTQPPFGLLWWYKSLVKPKMS